MNKLLEKQLDEIRIHLSDDIKNTNLILPISNKEIKDCLIEQVNLQSEWEDIVSFISSVYHRAEFEAEIIFSEKYNFVNKNANAILTTSELRHEANADIDYCNAKKLQNKAYGLKKRADGMLKTIETRKYVLKDMAGLIINWTEGYILK